MNSLHLQSSYWGATLAIAAAALLANTAITKALFRRPSQPSRAFPLTFAWAGALLAGPVLLLVAFDVLGNWNAPDQEFRIITEPLWAQKACVLLAPLLGSLAGVILARRHAAASTR